MEILEAKKHIISLANGIDPITGAIISDDSPYLHPDIIRSLFTVANNLRYTKREHKSVKEKQAQNLKDGEPENAGMAWTKDLRIEVAKLFG